MTVRTETQIAIRLRASLGKEYRYEQYVDNGPGAQQTQTKLDLKTAQNQLGLYTKTAEATIVTREVTIDEGDWVVVETSEVKRLAEILHSKQCNWNHTDGCDWLYGKNTHAHKKYEEKAEKLLEVSTFDAIVALVELM